MRLILFATIVLCGFLAVNAQETPASQTLSEQEWEKLFSALEAEDWEKSAELSKQYLGRIKSEDSEKTLARLRYMLLFSSAGKVTLGKMSYDELKTVADPLVGQEVQLPYGEIIKECRGRLGAICFTPKGSHDVSTASTNSKGTYIHAFVYTALREKFDYDAHLGEFATVRGVIQSIQYNPNQSKIWIMRVSLKDGSVVMARNQYAQEGAIVTTINNGDFVHPTFSPDGKVLAYANVVVKGDFENTEIFLHDLSTNRRSILLNSRKAAAYGTYKAFVTEMKWTSARRLEVMISDGDVDSTKLIFDPRRGRLLREHAEGGDELDTRPLSAVAPGQGIVLQKNYAGHDANVWFLDFQNKSVRALINLPDDSVNAFNGGVEFKSAIVLALSRGTKTSLFLYRDGKVSTLGEFNSIGFSWIEVKHVSSSRVIFLLRTHETSDRGDNPLFVFDGTQLRRIKEYSELYDAAVDPAGHRIAYCYWAGDKRHIVVKELN